MLLCLNEGEEYSTWEAANDYLKKSGVLLTVPCATRTVRILYREADQACHVHTTWQDHASSAAFLRIVHWNNLVSIMTGQKENAGKHNARKTAVSSDAPVQTAKEPGHQQKRKKTRQNKSSKTVKVEHLYARTH
jgi:hypothetical protein